jgi:HK97 family phage major capsid protein
MNLKATQEKIAELTQRLSDIGDLATAENRDFTDVERTEFDNGLTEIERLKVDAEKLEKLEAFRRDQAKTAGVPIAKTSKEEERALDNFSWQKAIQGAVTGRIDGLEGELSQEGEKEMKRLGHGTSGNGIVVPSSVMTHKRAVITESGVKATQVQSFVDAVYAMTILGDLGITRFNTTDDSLIPILGAVTTEWATEVADAADGGSVTTNMTLSPRRLTTFVDYGKQAAMRVSESYEGALVSAIQKSLAAKVERAVFTDDSASGAFKPIFDGKTAVTAASLTAVAVALIEQVMGNNHEQGNLGFAASTELFGDLLTAAQISNVNPLVVNEAIMGRKLRFSSQMAQITAKDPIYYGDWSKFQMAQFGGIEILADPYTQARKATVRLIMNSYWDAKLVQGAAISLGTLT